MGLCGKGREGGLNVVCERENLMRPYREDRVWGRSCQCGEEQVTAFPLFQMEFFPKSLLSSPSLPWRKLLNIYVKVICFSKTTPETRVCSLNLLHHTDHILQAGSSNFFPFQARTDPENGLSVHIEHVHQKNHKRRLSQRTKTMDGKYLQ